jgi:hypothetical protein
LRTSPEISRMPLSSTVQTSASEAWGACSTGGAATVASSSKLRSRSWASSSSRVSNPPAGSPSCGSSEGNASETGAGVDEGDAPALGELGGHALQARADDARETADGALRDRQVRQAVDVQVQHPPGLLGVGAVERADQREGRKVDALGGQPCAADGADQPFDHVALSGDEDDALTGPGGRLDDAQRVEVEDGVVERHRDLVLSLEGDGGLKLLVVGDRRKLEDPQNRALVGDADPDALAEARRGEHLTQRVREGLLVEHFTIAHGVGGEGRRDGVLSGD